MTDIDKRGVLDEEVFTHKPINFPLRLRVKLFLKEIV